MIIQFPKRPHHVRTSTGSRAAKTVIISAVTPADLATSVAKITDHHSAGILSRWSHLRAADTLAPISAAIASAEAQSPITARKEVGAIIESDVGQIVLSCKANLSQDYGQPHRINCRMAQKQPATAFTKAFQARIIEARRAKGYSQTKIAKLLSENLDQGTYKQYETRPGSLLPHEHVARFIALCDIDFEWLFTGDGLAPARLSKPKKSAAVRNTNEPNHLPKKQASSR